MSGTLLHDSNAQTLLTHSSFDVPVQHDFLQTQTQHHASLHIAYSSRLSPLEAKFNMVIKRVVDLMLSTIFIVTVLPWLFPMIALLIKLDSKGPVFFLQKRNKLNGEIFTCIKFRTMYKNDEADSLAAVEDDDRITPVGKFLREHHLDELPQLLNVFLGDMAVVGPRPHMISDNNKFEQLIPYYHHRHKVKPGITGLSQVLGFVGPVSDEENIKERIENDIYYVYHWSALLDAKIACRTVFKMIGLRA
jgi:putative colanic acid biosysnthesis UDP-glucose lipid carrier transferase